MSLSFPQCCQQAFNRLWRFLLSFSTRRNHTFSDRHCLFRHVFHLASPLLGLLIILLGSLIALLIRLADGSHRWTRPEDVVLRAVGRLQAIAQTAAR